MTQTVPSLSIVCMAIASAAAFAIAIGLFIFFRKKKKADVLPYFVGCAVFVLFALVLEGAVNSAVSKTAFGADMMSKTWLYALYGGLMAGLFEECGRFCAFKTVLRGKQDKDVNALMYGAGHGGCEAVILLGISMISNISFALMVNSGNTEALLSTGAQAQLDTVIRTLTETPSWTFLVGIIERVFAVTIHLALSVIVWFAAKKDGKPVLLLLAILLHALADGIMVVAASVLPTLAVEALIGVSVAVIAFIAYRIWRKFHVTNEAAIS